VIRGLVILWFGELVMYIKKQVSLVWRFVFLSGWDGMGWV
jgi:hypothetical protein